MWSRRWPRRRRGVQRAAYSVPHVYPSAAPALRVGTAHSNDPPADRQRPAPLRPRALLPVPSQLVPLRGEGRRPARGDGALRRRAAARARMDSGGGAASPSSSWAGGRPTALPSDLLDAVLGSVFDRVTAQGAAGPHHRDVAGDSSPPDERFAVLGLSRNRPCQHGGAEPWCPRCSTPSTAARSSPRPPQLPCRLLVDLGARGEHRSDLRPTGRDAGGFRSKTSPDPGGAGRPRT